MTAPSPSSAEPSSWAVTWLFCIWKTCTCPGGLSSFWVLCQPCLFVCVWTVFVRNTVFLGMGYQFKKILETWFAKTNKCKSGVPRKKHFYKGSVLCVCVWVWEREDFGSNILSQLCFFVVALFCFLFFAEYSCFLHTVQSLILEWITCTCGVSTFIWRERIYISVAALKMNDILQELFLADNRLMPSDGIQLGNLLKYNHSLTLLDLRNNHLQVSVYHFHHCEEVQLLWLV